MLYTYSLVCIHDRMEDDSYFNLSENIVCIRNEAKKKFNILLCQWKNVFKISAEKAFKKIMFCNMIARMKRLQGNFLFTWKEKIYQWFILFFESRILCFHYPFLSKHKESAFSKLTAFFKDKSKVKFILMPGYTGSFAWEFLTYKRAHYLNTSIQVFLTPSISLTWLSLLTRLYVVRMSRIKNASYDSLA